jgi:hypothetical protein
MCDFTSSILVPVRETPDSSKSTRASSGREKEVRLHHTDLILIEYRADMSPYGGSIATPTRKGPLVPRSYALPGDGSKALTVFPLASRSEAPDELLAFLKDTFNDVVREGRTYPQMNELSLDEFVSCLRFPHFSSTLRGAAATRAEQPD